MERRWAWFRKLLKVVDKKFINIFPAEWKVPQRLCLQFLARSRIHLSALLSSTSPTISSNSDHISAGNVDVNILLRALQTALRFEQEMRTRFDSSGNRATSSNLKLDEEGGGFPAEELSVEAIKSKYKNIKAEEAEKQQQQQLQQQQSSLVPKLPFEVRLKRREEGTLFAPSVAAMGVAAAAKSLEDEENITLSRLAVIDGELSVSAVFDDSLGPYVLMERRNLEEMLVKLAQEEDREGLKSGEGGSGSVSTSGSKVFASSMGMFVYIKNSIKRCTTLTTGNAFLLLSKEFRACLIKYAESLRARCPSPTMVQGQAVFKISPITEVLIYIPYINSVLVFVKIC